MAEARLSGYIKEWDVKSSPATNLSGGTSRSEYTSWPIAKSAGTGATVAVNNSAINTGTQLVGGTFKIYRSVFIYEIPNNLTRLDETPQFKFYPYTISGNPSFIACSLSDSYANKSSFTTGQAAPTGWFTNIQTAGSSVYSAADTGVVEDEYNTVNLDANNGLASFHILSRPFFSISLVDYTYDYSDSQPSSTNIMGIQMAADPNPPFLVLRKPWFVDDRGNEFPVDGDYTIRPFDVGVNQRDRAVPQLPFSTAIKGPAFLRGKNSSYKVTT